MSLLLQTHFLAHSLYFEYVFISVMCTVQQTKGEGRRRPIKAARLDR